MKSIQTSRYSKGRSTGRSRLSRTSAAGRNVELLESRWLLSAPDAPSDLYALTISTTEIHLTWKHTSTSANREDGFEIDFSTDQLFNSNVTTLVAGRDTVSKWVTGLPEPTTEDIPYYFRVRAVNGDGPSGYADTQATLPRPRSQVNVTGFTKADIINAINASNPGDTIFFPAGTYTIPSRIRSSDLQPGKLGGGRVYKGTTILTTASDGTTTVIPGTILRTTSTATASSDRVFFYITQNDLGAGYNIKFSNFTFEGAGIFTDSTTVERVVISDCHFDVKNPPSFTGASSYGIQWTIRMKDTSIINNVFSSSSAQSIFGYNWDHLVVANNDFSGTAGLHIDGQQTSEPNLLIEQNDFHEIRYFAVEVQGYGTGVVVQDNYYDNPVLGPTVESNLSTFGYSIPLTESSGTISRRNFAKAPTAPANGNGVRIMYELGGSNLDSYDNNCDGGWRSMAVTAVGASGSVHDNRVLSSYASPETDPGKGITTSLINNGPDVQLTWSLDRPRSAPHRRVYGLVIASGILTVSGTKLADSVAITDDRTDLALTLNGEPFTYPLASIDTILFEAQPTANSPSGTIIMSELSIPSGVVLDLTNNSMIIDYTGSVGNLVDDVRQHLLNGRLTTTATVGTGTTTIGYGDNAIALLQRSSFAGVTFPASDYTQILLKFTYEGDADLDGDVDVADLGILASNWQTSQPWTGADFDYSGFVDVADLGLLASNWQAGVSNPLGETFDEAWYRIRHGGRPGPDSESDEHAYESIAAELGLSAEELAAILAVWGANAGGPVL